MAVSYTHLDVYKRQDEDTSTGLLARPNWGYCEHNEPRAEVEWSYEMCIRDRSMLVFLSTISSRRSFGMTMSVSTFWDRRSMP